jgi:hypothetical protein
MSSIETREQFDWSYAGGRTEGKVRELVRAGTGRNTICVWWMRLVDER